jgi:hypothetical protein
MDQPDQADGQHLSMIEENLFCEISEAIDDFSKLSPCNLDSSEKDQTSRGRVIIAEKSRRF